MNIHVYKSKPQNSSPHSERGIYWLKEERTTSSQHLELLWGQREWGGLEVGNVTDSSQTPENKAHLFIAELLPMKCVHSNSDKLWSCVRLDRKIYIHSESSLKSHRIWKPMDVIKLDENNNNTSRGRKHKSFPEMWADIPRSAMAPAFLTNSQSPLALVQRVKGTHMELYCQENHWIHTLFGLNA